MIGSWQAQPRGHFLASLDTVTGTLRRYYRGENGRPIACGTLEVRPWDMDYKFGNGQAVETFRVDGAEAFEQGPVAA